jgi:hypothetical protein
MSPRSIATVLARIRRRRAESDPDTHPAGELGALSPEDRRIVERALPYTMTSVARLQAVVDATRFCVRRQVTGAFAECGVWRGGSVLAMILTLQELGVQDREIHLYDTFEGMTRPTEEDVSELDGSALDAWTKAGEQGQRAWPEVFGDDRFNEDDVRRTLLSTGYPAEHIRLVRGPVEETLPTHAPERLALLRLDTDWYESTRHELLHLYPRLVDGGVLIIDDYGHWQGARQAPPLLLSRTDYTGRIAVKH